MMDFYELRAAIIASNGRKNEISKTINQDIERAFAQQILPKFLRGTWKSGAKELHTFGSNYLRAHPSASSGEFDHTTFYRSEGSMGTATIGNTVMVTQPYPSSGKLTIADPMFDVTDLKAFDADWYYPGYANAYLVAHKSLVLPEHWKE